MGSVTIDVVPYHGALLTLDLISGPQTIVLGDFGAETSGTLTDADGTLGPSDNGIATFSGQALTYVGSGTATPGVFVPGVGIVPLGTTVDVVSFEAGGQIYFHYPAGDPDLLGAVALVVDMDATPYPIFTPVCFADDTMISVPGGQRAARDIRPGDLVEDIDGNVHSVIWSSHREVNLSVFGPRARASLAPVVLPASLIGRHGMGDRLVVSRNHLIHFRHTLAQLYFGSSRVLLPAGAFVGTLGKIDATAPRITYVHFMCAAHAVVRANGVAAETFFPGPQALSSLTPVQKRELERNPICLNAARTMRHAAPVLGMKDAKFLLSEIFQHGGVENKDPIPIH